MYIVITESNTGIKVTGVKYVLASFSERAYVETNNITAEIKITYNTANKTINSYNEHAKDEEADSMSLMMLGMLIPMMKYQLLQKQLLFQGYLFLKRFYIYYLHLVQPYLQLMKR